MHFPLVLVGCLFLFLPVAFLDSVAVANEGNEEDDNDHNDDDDVDRRNRPDWILFDCDVVVCQGLETICALEACCCVITCRFVNERCYLERILGLQLKMDVSVANKASLLFERTFSNWAVGAIFVYEETFEITYGFVIVLFVIGV